MTENLPVPDDSRILIYQSDTGETQLEVRLQDETVWLTQKLMSELFDKDIRTINEHIKNIYEEGELEPKATIRKFRIVQIEEARQVRHIVFKEGELTSKATVKKYLTVRGGDGE